MCTALQASIIFDAFLLVWIMITSIMSFFTLNFYFVVINFLSYVSYGVKTTGITEFYAGLAFNPMLNVFSAVGLLFALIFIKGAMIGVETAA